MDLKYFFTEKIYIYFKKCWVETRGGDMTVNNAAEQQNWITARSLVFTLASLDSRWLTGEGKSNIPSASMPELVTGERALMERERKQNNLICYTLHSGKRLVSAASPGFILNKQKTPGLPRQTALIAGRLWRPHTALSQWTLFFYPSAKKLH